MTQRPIEFRYYYTPKDYPHIKEMHYFNLFSFGSDDGSQWIYTTVNGKESQLHCYGLEQYPVMQFTGLYDKDKKKIFEGDIVLDWEGIDRYKVVWNSQWACFELERLTFNSDTSQEIDNAINDLTVIGDIYQNSDLLSA